MATLLGRDLVKPDLIYVNKSRTWHAYLQKAQLGDGWYVREAKYGKSQWPPHPHKEYADAKAHYDRLVATMDAADALGVKP